MPDPAGETLSLSHGPFRADVVTVGAGLRSLTLDGHDLVAGYPPGTMCADYRGAVLMPWPNRVGDGAYEFGGVTHQLALTEPEHHNALHGLTSWVAWTVAEHGSDHAALTYALPPQPGYPFALELGAAYRLDDGGLRVTLTATNVGPDAAPYATGHHPYLTVGRRVDECVLTLPASTWCAMSERGLPSPATDVAGTAYDFREPRPIGDLVIDHPFSGLTEHPTVVLADPESGREVRLSAGDGFGWLHLYTGDNSTGPRRSLAVEPTTGPPDAFRSGVDLLVLEPGATHAASFTITGS